MLFNKGACNAKNMLFSPLPLPSHTSLHVVTEVFGEFGKDRQIKNSPIYNNASVSMVLRIKIAKFKTES